MPGRKKKAVTDNRVTIKIDKALWKVILNQIENHPEWGMSSVSDFIRRSVDRELEYRTMTAGQKMLEIQLTPRGLPRDSRDKGP
ncbi:MAG TPA: hypothetical protein VGB78_05325 [Thermoplasmata archaeon]|jgi:hypothetical protein